VETVKLCSSSTRDVEAYLKDGELHIEGSDTGELVSKVWGDSDYEFFYTLTSDDTDKLRSLLKAEFSEDELLLLLIKAKFSRGKGCERFARYCEKHGLKYEFAKYA